MEVPNPLAPAATSPVPDERHDALATTTGDRLGAPRPPQDDSIIRDAGEAVEHASQPRVARAEAATTAASPLWTPAGLLLLCWLALIAALLLIRHVHATLVPAASPFEFAPAFEPGTTDAQTVTIGLVVAAVLAAIWLTTRRGRRDIPPAAARLVRWWPLVAAATVGVAFLVLLMLFRPLPAGTDCPTSRIVHFNNRMGFVWNCDSSLFQQVANNPLKLLEEGHPRQSRPVYALIGAGIVHTVGRAIGWLGLGQWQGEDTRAFISLVLLNVVILIAAVVLFARQQLSMGTPVIITAALATPLALNHVTAEWTLTPHQQTFAMLVPIVTVLAARQAILDPPGWRAATWWGLGLGLAALAYGSWIITVPVVVASLFIKLRLAAIRAVGAFLAAFSAPIVAWMAVCRIVAGSYYNHEVEAYREFVWVLDSIKLGPSDLWQRSMSYLILTVREILGTRELWVVGAVMALGIALTAVARISLRPDTPQERATLVGIGLTSSATVLFLWGMGFYTPRLSVGLLPPLLIATGWVYSRLAAGLEIQTKKFLAVAAPIGMVWWLAFMLT